ncbi:hypothetical protein BGZ79_006470 [Entomortierella chlamydospora]|nr:hypothetical protein BGZ79_006470 [Entomortierella chlamydospora]
MLPDNGFLTIREAWDEFHGPIAQARSYDSRWPFNRNADRRYRRRAEFINIIKARAEKAGQSSDFYLSEFEKKYSGRTINSILEELKREAKGVPPLASLNPEEEPEVQE